VFKVIIYILVLFQLSACEKASKSTVSTKKQVTDAACLTTQSQCQVNTELGSFLVKFSQSQSNLSKEGLQQIQTEQPFSITLNSVNSDLSMNKIKAVSAYLEGKDMFMGKVPVLFNKEEVSDMFVASSLLASCSEDIMVWRLWLTVKMANQQDSEQSFFIDFESIRL